MEEQMRAICAGTTSRMAVVQTNLEKYREVFIRSVQQLEVLKAVSLIDASLVLASADG